MKADSSTEIQFLGDLSPLLMHRHGKQPERRQVSKRWLTSSVLVGMTSLLLMGGALTAALEGREQLTVPAQSYKRLSDSGDLQKAPKGNHPGLRAKLQDDQSNIMMVSTVSRVGEKNVVKLRPFMNIKSNLATAPRPQEDYPRFNALNVFSESSANEIVAKTNDFMYGADVEGEVTLNVVDFPYDQAADSARPRQANTEIAQQIRSIAHNLEGGGSYVSALA